MTFKTLADPMFKQFWKDEVQEIEDPYEKGFVDGMQKQMQSSVDKFFEKAKTVAKQIDNGTYSKELSDEEIMEIYDRDELYTIMDGQMYLKPIEFARELLKKASEK
jgi:hypothetical protein